MKKISVNSKFSSKHQNMMSAVIAFCVESDNVAVTQSIAAFFEVINLIKENLERIISIQGQVNSTVTGIAEQKKGIKNSLVETSSLIMQTVYAYAIKNGLYELAAKMKMTASKLRKMKDSVLTGTVEGAITNVTGVLAQLTAYNITEDVVDTWSETLASFKNIVSRPKVANDEMDALRNRVQDYLRENMILLHTQADAIALQFKNDANTINYFCGYRKARKLIPLVKHTKLRILVTTTAGTPVPHVMVEQNDSSSYVITDVNGRGNLYIQIPTGETELKSVYTFTLSKDTLSKKTPEMVIKRGQTVTCNFVMNVDGFIIPETEKIFAESKNSS